MSRDLSPELKELFGDAEVSPFFAIEMYFDNDQTLRLWTGNGTVVIEGETYVGTGNILEVSEIEETAEIAAKGATLTLQGAPEEIVSLALQEPYQGRVCKIFFGSIDLRGVTSSLLLESPSNSFLLLESGDKINLDGDLFFSEIFSGFMDTIDISDAGDSSVIELRVLNKLVDLERARVARYTSSFQKFLYPQDKGFDFVESLQDKVVFWGRGSG